MTRLVRSRRFRSGFVGLMAICSAVIFAGVTPQAAAQRYIGGPTYPSVTVDMSVLDELGRAPNLPQLYQQQRQARPYPYNYNVQPRFPVVRGDNGFSSAPRIVLTPPKPAKKRVRRAPRENMAIPPAPRKTVKTARRPAPNKKRITPRRSRIPAPPQIPTARAPMPVAPPPPPPMIAPLPPPDTPKIAVPPPPPPPVIASASPRVRKPAPPSPRTIVKRAPKKPRQIAALPRGEARVKSGSMRRIQFATGSAKLAGTANSELTNIAKAMAGDKALRIQLLAYAGQAADSASQARRLSLWRALAARSKLIEQGIRSTRIDVRALGNKSAGGPADRVDIIVTKR